MRVSLFRWKGRLLKVTDYGTDVQCYEFFVRYN